MFRSAFAMNDPCPVCGLIFQREEGYFLGAMYVSYGLASVLLVPLYFVLAALLPGWNGIAVAALATLPYLPLTPAVFRYSRIVWVYLDRAVDPTEINAGLYEKIRLSEMEEEGREGPAEPPASHGLRHGDSDRP